MWQRVSDKNRDLGRSAIPWVYYGNHISNGCVHLQRPYDLDRYEMADSAGKTAVPQGGEVFADFFIRSEVSGGKEKCE